jgi:hypothetical protein
MINKQGGRVIRGSMPTGGRHMAVARDVIQRGCIVMHQIAEIREQPHHFSQIGHFFLKRIALVNQITHASINLMGFFSREQIAHFLRHAFPLNIAVDNGNKLLPARL